MKLNYIILTHTNPQQLFRLIQRLTDSNSSFFIHVDSSEDIAPFKQFFNDFENVHFVDDNKRQNAIWGDYSLVAATLAAIEMIQNYSTANENEYCLLLSGQDYPIKPVNEIRAFLEQNYGQNYIDGNKLPISDWEASGMDRIEAYNFHPSKKERKLLTLYPFTRKAAYTKTNLKIIYGLSRIGNVLKFSQLWKNRKFPAYLTPYGGAQWWALPIETISMISNFLKEHPDYISYHKYTHVPDEIFFQSIVHSIIDHKAISKELTYVNWFRKGCPLPVTFNIDDFTELSQNKSLFARKFDVDYDSQILDRIDKELLKV